MSSAGDLGPLLPGCAVLAPEQGVLPLRREREEHRDDDGEDGRNVESNYCSAQLAR